MIIKQAVPINFSQGLNTKPDPKQVPVGQFLSLENSIFDVIGLLKKRNGFQNLAPLSPVASYLTTFNGDLTAIGSSLSAYSTGSTEWVTKASIQPVSMSVMPLVRNSLNQKQCDSVVSANGNVCTVYSEYNGSSTAYKYVIADSATGQNIVAPTLIPAGSGTVTGSPRVFYLGNYFIVAYTNVISATYHLQYIAISSISPSVVTSPQDLATTYIPAAGLSWDGVVTGSSLYFAYNTTSPAQEINVSLLTQGNAAIGGSPSTPVAFSGQIATNMSICSDTTVPQSPIIYASYYDSAGETGYTVAVDQNLNKRMSPTEWISSPATQVVNVTCAAQSGVCTTFYERLNTYGYDSTIPTHLISTVPITLPATVTTGTVGSTVVMARSVGLASKAFIISGVIYVLTEYQSLFQPTYFLMSWNGTISSEVSPVVLAKLAYSNGAYNTANSPTDTNGYLPVGLPSVTLNGTTAKIAYLYQDLVEALTTQNNTQQLTAGGIYSQTGVNLVSFNISASTIDTAEIGNNLNISGGFLSAYDGFQQTEQNFFLWPDNVETVASGASGAMSPQQYYYQVTYEWSDNQGNIQRSAPSIPVTVTLTNSNTAAHVYVPYLRLTYKTNVKIVIYRWSAGQQVYHQVTSIQQPSLNSTSTDYLDYNDTQSDGDIAGNNIIYTTGGVIEDINGPASNIMTLFDTRLWLVDAEDPNLLWFSKQVIEATPVEMSDLLTFYVAPTTGAQGSTGPITALSVMDDKLIIFKKDAIYFINGSGPDNTGSNNQYYGPIFITSTVGCALQNSVVFTPNGLMFQSDKGIWLLGRDLSVSYIGAPVEQYTLQSQVVSAVGIPGTNQVRFTMNSQITLMYDYYVGQWGTFVGIPGISSTLFQGLHTFINSSGQVLQENPGVYLDGSNPVLMSFETSEFSLAGLQGYQRIFFFYLLGQYMSPHKLNVQVAYDYDPYPSEQVLIQPTNYTGVYGSDLVYGQTTPYGGPGSLEQWRVFTGKQRCSSFRVYLNEVYDGSLGAPAGAGLTISGLNCVIGVKKGFRPIASTATAGLSS